MNCPLCRIQLSTAGSWQSSSWPGGSFHRRVLVENARPQALGRVRIRNAHIYDTRLRKSTGFSGRLPFLHLWPRLYPHAYTQTLSLSLIYIHTSIYLFTYFSSQSFPPPFPFPFQTLSSVFVVKFPSPFIPPLLSLSFYPRLRLAEGKTEPVC